MSSAEAVAPLHNVHTEILRPLADFPEDIWGDCFASYSLDKQVYDRYTEEIEMLKEEVRSMIMATGKTMTEKLTLIDLVERLGISYHFEREIEEQVEEIFNLHANFEQFPESCGLSNAALHFRLFRQHGFNISCDIFAQFMEANGKFKESLSRDARGLLSLYQAAQLRTHGDSILEEALVFTTFQLKYGILPQASPTIAKEVKYALQQTLHKDTPRLAVRHYISIYEEDESNNQLLLRLAKLDYNVLQMLYKQELSQLMRWGNDLEIESKLPYSRARIVESYFFALALMFEPHYTLGRIIVAKSSVFITVVDDTYDSYGTLDELKTFTDALERWDASEIDRLPSYMKTSSMALLHLTDEIEKDLSRQGKSFAFYKYKEEWKTYARTSYTQSQWFFTRELPTFPDYLSNGLITGLGYIQMTTVLLGTECCTKEVFDWLSTNPKVLVSSAKICRLINDVGSYEREKKNGATGIECYMKHYNVSEHEAMEKFEEISENAWKDINEEFLRPTSMSLKIPKQFLNLARVVDVLYKHREDGFTDPHKVIEPHIIALLVDPINV